MYWWISVPLGFFCVASFIYDSVSTTILDILLALRRIDLSGEFTLCRNQILDSFHCSVLAFDACKQAEQVLGGFDGYGNVDTFGVG